jgi:hypothetical protein
LRAHSPTLISETGLENSTKKDFCEMDLVLIFMKKIHIIKPVMIPKTDRLYRQHSIILRKFIVFTFYLIALFISNFGFGANITPTRTDNPFTGWTDVSCNGTTYTYMLIATASMTSPVMDFTVYSGEALNFNARTYGGINATENTVTVWISTDNGSNWTNMGTRCPTSTTLTAMTAFDLSSYNGTQVLVKFTMAGTSNTIGVGLDDIAITGTPIAAAPVITSSLTANGTVGTVFSYSIVATNSPTSYSATGLPAGLSINTSTGVISGTPTAAGTTNVTIAATNGSGTDTQTLVITISLPAIPVITSVLTASGTVGVAFSYQITASNSPTSWGATPLPAGLSVNATGLITGTPTTIGVTNVTISATNASGTGSATLVITISLPAIPVITSALTASGTLGVAFSYQITASNSPTSWGATPLPAGTSVNATGLITGTPTTIGVTNVTISATNVGGTGSATLVITITDITFVNGDYRTTGSGSWVSNSAAPAIWEKFDGTSWNTSNSPTFASTSNVYIRSGHTITTGGSFGTSVNLKIENGGVFSCGHSSTTASIYIYNGGTLNVNAALTNAGSFDVEDGGTVVVNFAYGSGSTNSPIALFNGTENFRPNSTFKFTDFDCANDNLICDNTTLTANTYNGYTAVFGNIICDFQSNLTASDDWIMLAGGVTINMCHKNLTFRTTSTSANMRIGTTGTITSGIGGNLIIESTMTEQIHLKTSGTMTFTVEGNYLQDGGDFRVLPTSTASSSTLNIKGNMTINSGICYFNTTVSSNVITPIINLQGNLTIGASGTMIYQNTSRPLDAALNFTGDYTSTSTPQLIDVSTSTALINIPVYIKNKAYAQLINQNLKLAGSSTSMYSMITVESGGTFDFGFNGTTALNVVNNTTTPINGFATATPTSRFALLSGGTLKITSPDGIDADATDLIGNVQTNDDVSARSFATDATYHYIGKANQVTGDAITTLKHIPTNHINKKVIVELSGVAETLTLTDHVETGTLQFINGKVVLGSSGTKNLTLGTATTIGTQTGASSSNYVVTNGVTGSSPGTYTRTQLANSTDYLFPIGPTTSLYNPATLNYTGTVDGFSARVEIGLKPTTGADAFFVNRTWDISELVAGGSTASLSLQWETTPPTHENANFDRNNSNIYHYTGGQWVEQTGSTLGGTDPYTSTKTGLTSFSPWAVGKRNVFLPVEIISFSANCNDNGVELNWITASEINNDFFTLERSKDIKTWEILAVLKGAGNSNSVLNYSFTDENPLGEKYYYRLKQTDFDGKYDYFGPVVTNCSENIIGSFDAYPNPANNQVNCSVYSSFETEAEVELYNLFGQLILKKNVNLDEGSTVFSLDVSALTGGVYYLTLRNSSGSYFERKQLVVE